MLLLPGVQCACSALGVVEHPMRHLQQKHPADGKCITVGKNSTFFVPGLLQGWRCEGNGLKRERKILRSLPVAMIGQGTVVQSAKQQDNPAQ